MRRLRFRAGAKAGRGALWALLVSLLLLQGVPAGAQGSLVNMVGQAPLGALSGATGWMNSPPLTAKELRGKVVLVDFWDYSCINCIRAVPYLRAWADKYRADGLVVIGVHTPEFDVEKQPANVQRAVTKFGITFPVALDSDSKIWNAFHNQYWPADYLIDGNGKVRYTKFGEGDYAKDEQRLQELLGELGKKSGPGGVTAVRGQGAQAAADMKDLQSPETYLGYQRADRFVSPGGLKRDAQASYGLPGSLQLNQWALAGQWVDRGQGVVLAVPGGKVVFRFHARDVHMVLGPAMDGKEVRFRVTVDGHAPGSSHGADTDAQGHGVVKDDRLYQLIRQSGAVADHTFAIEFEDAGVEAFTFTFG